MTAADIARRADDDPAQRPYRRAGFDDIGRVFLTQPLARPVHEETA
jgi:hypothetical protein